MDFFPQDKQPPLATLYDFLSTSRNEAMRMASEAIEAMCGAFMHKYGAAGLLLYEFTPEMRFYFANDYLTEPLVLNEKEHADLIYLAARWRQIAPGMQPQEALIRIVPKDERVDLIVQLKPLELVELIEESRPHFEERSKQNLS